MSAAWQCKACRELYPTRRAMYEHPCGAREAAERARSLSWPVEPVVQLLTVRYGPYDPVTFDGFCNQLAARVTGMTFDSWKKSRSIGDFSDAQADAVATRLGGIHEVLWPGWHNALEVTDDDMRWLAAWSQGAVA